MRTKRGGKTTGPTGNFHKLREIGFTRNFYCPYFGDFLSLTQIISIMLFEFDQYLGFLAFVIILLLGFWIMFFLTAIIPYWIGGAVKDMMDERKERKQLEKEREAHS